MNTADKQTYIDAWDSHVREVVTGLGMLLIKATTADDRYYDELKAIQERLKVLIKIAADEVFEPKGKQDD